ncbi:MAG: RsmD family RNA methyltransferase [Thermoguttaceae bacterium]
MKKKTQPDSESTLFEINNDNRGHFDLSQYKDTSSQHTPVNESRRTDRKKTKKSAESSHTEKQERNNPTRQNADNKKGPNNKLRNKKGQTSKSPAKHAASKSAPQNKKRHKVGSEPGEKESVGLRVIGGHFRGAKLQYIGDNRVRPMKDRVREAVFNLIGPTIRGRHVIDLFGGTGAVTIEALSRGAVSATIIELHLPTAAKLRENLLSLELEKVCTLRKTDAFYWAKNKEEHPTAPTPWIVFCSPPYDFYIKRQEDVIEMLCNLLGTAPDDSLFVIESDDRFDFGILPRVPLPNKIRSYPPAQIAIFAK